MINFTSPDFIIGVIVTLVFGVFFLAGHVHGKSSVPDPVPAPKIPPTVAPDAVSEIKTAVADVKSVATESHGMLTKIHDHLFANKDPADKPPEPPKAV